MADAHAVATVDVHPVAVLADAAVDGDAFDLDILARQIVREPAGGIAQREPAHPHFSTLAEPDQVWASAVIAFLRREELALSVDRPFARQPDVLLALRVDQALGEASAIQVIDLRREARVVVDVRAAKQHGIRGDRQRDPAFQHERARKKHAFREAHRTPARPRAGVNRRLDRLRVERDTVRLCTKVAGRPCRILREGKARQQHARSRHDSPDLRTVAGNRPYQNRIRHFRSHLTSHAVSALISIQEPSRLPSCVNRRRSTGSPASVASANSIER
jgi:hypothetical protein